MYRLLCLFNAFPSNFQNSMVFRQCSIGGRVYRGDRGSLDSEEVSSIKPVSINSNRDNQPLEVNLWEAAKSSTSGLAAEPTSQGNAKTGKGKEAAAHFKDTTLLQDIEDSVNGDADSESAQHYRLLNGFFTVLSLCHTVLTSVDPVTGEIEYKAQSPDEAALVQAAADVGFVFCGRDRETLSVRTPSSTPDVEKYELLNILEFTSARKRMSVVLRKLGGDDERLFLLTKGADNVIFQRLKDNERDLMAETEEHLSEFANGGLRTLTLAYKVISGMFTYPFFSW